PVAILPIAEPKIAVPEDLPIAEPEASEVSMAPPPSVTEMPADGAGDVVAAGTALERLRMDPSVYVQPLPVRRPAGAVKSKPAGGLSGTAGASKGEPVLQM